MPDFLDRTDHFRLIQKLTYIAAIFLLLPLPIQFIGEEAVFAISAYEMALRGDWLQPTLYDVIFHRPPLYNIFVILTGNLIGWQHSDIAVRLVSIFASWGSALVAAWLALHIFKSRRSAWLAGLLFLTMGETMFWYGWLGYADMLFSFFLFAAVAALWKGIEGSLLSWYALALLMLAAAIATKALTAVVFFGVSALVLAYGYKKWRFLFSLPVLVLSPLPLLVPFLWAEATGHAGHTSGLLNDILIRFHTAFDGQPYLLHLLAFPLESAVRVLPVLGLILLLIWKKQLPAITLPMKLLLLIITINYLPYWLAPGSSMRYLVPFYGFVAVLFTGWIAATTAETMKKALVLTMVILALKVPFSFLALPYAKGGYGGSGDLQEVASDIILTASDRPIYSINDTATGMGVCGYIDMKLPAERFVKHPPKEGKGVVLTYNPSNSYGELLKHYTIRNSNMYLYSLNH